MREWRKEQMRVLKHLVANHRDDTYERSDARCVRRPFTGCCCFFFPYGGKKGLIIPADDIRNEIAYCSAMLFRCKHYVDDDAMRAFIAVHG